MISRLILILSSERSGSTLLRVMLGEHSRIVAPAELFLLRYPDYRAWRAAKPEAMHSLTEYFELLDQPKTVTEIDAACAQRDTFEVYEWLFAALPPDALLLDKTPAYANRMETLQRSLAVHPFYVWLIRHPLGVIDSHLRLKRKEHGGVRWFRRRINERIQRLLDSGMTQLARRREAKWVEQNRNIRDFLATVPASQQCVIRFEELVTDPRSALAPLCQALGLGLEPSLLSPHTKKRSMKPGIGDPNFDTHDRVDQEPAFDWKQRLSERSLTPETMEFMRQIGVFGARVSREG